MIDYTISYNNSHRHFVDFELSTKTLGKDKMQFQLPAWRPGRYELANFAQNIQNGVHRKQVILLQLQDFGPWTIMAINLLQLSLMVQLLNGIQMQREQHPQGQPSLPMLQQQRYKL